ncbi:uncharacterized protein LOC134264507 [Saccostrea cucullata]|uniref:uncharacterized protein LOC134264507 n=1 Tax=Saccostrea cuccullata TaxID=36930 RepID=UPI002ED4A833
MLINGREFGMRQLFNEVGAESMNTDHHEGSLVSVKKAKDLNKLSEKYGKGVTPMDVDNQENESMFQRNFYFLEGNTNTCMNKEKKMEMIQTGKRTTFEKGKVVDGNTQALKDLLKDQENLKEGTTGVIIKELKSSDMGNFVEKETLGEGSYGAVVRYKNLANNKQLAMKKVRKNFTVGEVLMLASLEHKNIITVYGYIKTDGISNILMEFAGINLENFVLNVNMVEEELLWSIIRQALFALEYLDQKEIKHFDLKPANICVTDSIVVKLTDFGSARKGMPESGSLVCTHEYMAPEMCVFVKPHASVKKTDMPLTGKSDVFALGLVIQYILDREHTQLKFYGQFFRNMEQLREKIIFYNAMNPDMVLTKMITENGNDAIRKLLKKLLQGWPQNRPTAAQALCMV